MSLNFTPIARRILIPSITRALHAADEAGRVQEELLRSMLRKASATVYGLRYGFEALAQSPTVTKDFAGTVPLINYEDVRPLIIRMIHGEKEILWPGQCLSYAQSSGTSGGPSKYIPVTLDSLRLNHYRGSACSVASYLRTNPGSRMFSGKGLILGGSFSNTLAEPHPGVKVGDLSATLIDRIPAAANIFRIPSKKIALMPDWEEKLPLLAAEAAKCRNITNISGVPSWCLVMLRKVLEITGHSTLREVWPGLEVFFHGGISFHPYREQYRHLIGDDDGMHYLETYNASEGFFGVQTDPESHALLLMVDAGVYYEFRSPGEETTVGIDSVVPGEIYELIITASNGLWRYSLGDTVKIESVNPVKITIAGRTKTFINAFGEELMEQNAEQAIADACHATGALIVNYTAAPIYADEQGHRGRHQWLIEWLREPSDPAKFAEVLDARLMELNSDYAAKRAHTIFLDPPLVTSAPRGLFNQWLRRAGSGKLGGQRKIPRLSNDRRIIDEMLSLINTP